MKCISPISIRTKEGRQHVPCGTCINCLTKRQQDWSFRLHQEQKQSITSNFITITYDQNNIPILEYPDKNGEARYTFQLKKRDLQLFMKKLRKAHEKQIKDFNKIKEIYNAEIPKLRYYAVGEYGSETKRPHYHIILFNINPQTLTKIPEIWGKGQTDIGEVTSKSITYVTKYVITSRNQYYGHRQKPFSTMSKQPGIGNSYLANNKKWHKDNKYFYVINTSGAKQALPSYYTDKIFNKIEKENHKLKNEPLLVEQEIREDARQEKLGNNPYWVRQQKIERKIAKSKQTTKTHKL